MRNIPGMSSEPTEPRPPAGLYTGVAPGSAPVLSVQGLTKHFGDRTALDGVSFDVAPGRLTGFVGGNGAGKTTTMRIILGLINADTGAVHYGGSPIDADDRRAIGYMPEERGLYPKMRVREQLIYLARLHGLSPARAQANADALLESLTLTERAGDEIQSLSLGNQQRAQIAAALVHDPEILILDEPFSGLDPLAVEAVAATLAERAARGTPVLFSSHQLDIVERLCDELVIIAHGAVKAAGPRERLRAQFAEPRYRISLDGDAGWVRQVPGVTVVEFAGGSALFEADRPDTAQTVLRRAIAIAPVREFSPQTPTLTEIFKEVVQ